MELTAYQCPVCGFVHEVPDYWTSFKPEEEIEQIHINLKTKEMCECTRLEIIKEDSE